MALKTEPKPIESVDMEELEAILEDARASLSEEQHRKLKAAIETLAYLTGEIEDKRTTIAKLRKLLFGSESEKSEHVLKGIEDDEPGDNDDGNDSDVDPAGESSKKKRKGHGRNGAKDYVGAERIKIPHETLTPGCPCPLDRCEGKVYRLADPAFLVRVTGKSPLSAKVYERERLRCNLCLTVFTAKPPTGIGEGKYDESSASMIALLKYGSGLPFNRLERLGWNLGIPLPAATQWEIVHGAAGSIAAAYEELIRQAAQGEVLHNDDTGMKILEHMGKRWKKKQAKSKKKGKSTSKSKERAVFTSGIVSVGAGRKVALFFTGRKHAGENLARVLAERAAELEAPIQMCDALAQNMSGNFGAIVANCLAHGRRNFVGIAQSFPTECKRVLETFAEVYKRDAEARQLGLSPVRRLAFHREHSRRPMIELLDWFRREIRERRIEPNSPLGEAIAYMKKHWRELTLFYRHAGAPLDNNVCEIALKRAIIHRKNAYFYRSDKGAGVGDLFMSLIYSAELSGARPFDYLTELQRHAGELAENPAEWMPWNYRETLARIASNPS